MKLTELRGRWAARLVAGTEEAPADAPEMSPEISRDQDSFQAAEELLPTTLVERLHRIVRRSLWLSGAGLALTLPLPWLTGLGNPSYLVATFIVILLGLLLARAELREDRALFVGLFGISLLIHQVSHLALFWLGTAAGGPFLGPDSSSYLHRSQEAAELGFPLDLSLASNFGTYDLAHVYLFGAAVEYLDADLFCLQTINGGLMALVAALTFSWSRIVLPRYAMVVGAAVALFPSLVVLASIDLLKDPSLTCALALGLWALFKLTEAKGWAERAVYVTAGALGLAYVHMARFYLLTHLEIAVAGAFLVGLLRRRRRRSLGEGAGGAWAPRGAIMLSLLLLFGLAELCPRLVGWPLSPVFYLRTVARTPENPTITEYAPGLTEDLVRRPSTGDEPTASSPPSPPSPVSAEPADPRPVEREALRLPAPEPEPGEASKRPRARPPGGRVAPEDGTALEAAANFIRRFFGPFVWVLPEEWDAAYILQRDFLYFPGMLIWYLLWPLVAAGVVISGSRMVRSEGLPLGLAVLTGYVLLSLAQYAVLNLSYRQRDTLFPQLAVFAVLGLSAFRRFTVLRYAYAVYWLLLVALAAAHLLLRNRLVG